MEVNLATAAVVLLEVVVPVAVVAAAVVDVAADVSDIAPAFAAAPKTFLYLAEKKFHSCVDVDDEVPKFAVSAIVPDAVPVPAAAAAAVYVGEAQHEEQRHPEHETAVVVVEEGVVVVVAGVHVVLAWCLSFLVAAELVATESPMVVSNDYLAAVGPQAFSDTLSVASRPHLELVPLFAWHCDWDIAHTTQLPTGHASKGQ